MQLDGVFFLRVELDADRDADQVRQAGGSPLGRISRGLTGGGGGGIRKLTGGGEAIGLGTADGVQRGADGAACGLGEGLNLRGQEGTLYNFDFSQQTPRLGLPTIPAIGAKATF